MTRLPRCFPRKIVLLSPRFLGGAVLSGEVGITRCPDLDAIAVLAPPTAAPHQPNTGRRNESLGGWTPCFNKRARAVTRRRARKWFSRGPRDARFALWAEESVS